MLISLIACVSNNGIIGNKGKMPWNNKEEMTFFKEKTTNHPVIMGKNTYDSLNNKPLKNRFNIVVTSNTDLYTVSPSTPHGPVYVSSLKDAIDLVGDETNEIFIIGGRRIYNDALVLDYIDRMYLNVLTENYEGDTDFPYYNPDEWLITPSEIQYKTFKSYLLQKRRQQI